MWVNRLLQASYLLSHLPRLLMAIILSKLRGNGHANLALEWLRSVHCTKPVFGLTKKTNYGRMRNSNSDAREEQQAESRVEGPEDAGEGHDNRGGVVKLYTWDHSYFSGKVRA